MPPQKATPTPTSPRSPLDDRSAALRKQTGRGRVRGTRSFVKALRRATEAPRGTAWRRDEYIPRKTRGSSSVLPRCGMNRANGLASAPHETSGTRSSAPGRTAVEDLAAPSSPPSWSANVKTATFGQRSQDTNASANRSKPSRGSKSRGVTTAVPSGIRQRIGSKKKKKNRPPRITSARRVLPVRRMRNGAIHKRHPAPQDSCCASSFQAAPGIAKPLPVNPRDLPEHLTHFSTLSNPELIGSLLSLPPGLTLYDVTRSPRKLPPDKESSILNHSVSLSEVNLDQELSCPICMGILHNVAIVKSCMHRFCESCIERWLRTCHQDCPQCRQRIPSRRFLRTDPIFEGILARLFPNVQEFERLKDEALAAVNQRFRCDRQLGRRNSDVELQR